MQPYNLFILGVCWYMCHGIGVGVVLCDSIQICI